MYPHTKFIIISLLLLAVVFIRCSDKFTDDGSVQEIKFPLFSAADAEKGGIVAARYCRSCHQLPEPSLLTKSVWAYHILPMMGQYEGIPSPYGLHVPQIDKNYTPAKPVMTPLEWKQINAYYITKSPAHMPALSRLEPQHWLPFFKIEPTPVQWISTRSFTSMVKIDSSVSPHRVIVSDGLNNKLVILDDKLKTVNTLTLNSAIVNLLFGNHKITATTIGLNLEANDLKNGSITDIDIDSKGNLAVKGEPLFVGLNRPLSVDAIDLNQDGMQDYLITQFGKMAGGLSWFEGTGYKAKEHKLRDKPGCLQVITEFNTLTKWPDIWALFGQADEGVFLYTNKGKGVFEEKRILSFPPSYGSVCFDLVDLNGDGFKDIIYACGDNADDSQILKPYHGVYIYLNNGKNNFKQRFFYPIHGCNRFIAKDFDGDGDLDIAAISEYPGAKTPWESFIYLENKRNFSFKAYSMPLDVKFSRGMTMDAGDLDGDGKPDLLLGSGFAADNIKGNDKQPLFVLLKNISKSKKYL